MTITRPPDTSGSGTGTGSGAGTGQHHTGGGLRIAGLPVRLTFGAHLLAMLAVLAGALVLPDAAPGWPAAAYLGATAGLVAGLLVSLVIHELAHAVVARGYGTAVAEIRIGFFGGAEHGRGEYAMPRGLWRAAAAGPAASLVLAAFSAGVALTLAGLGAGALPAAVFAALAWINAALTVANLLPGGGMDGGRVVQALAWARSGDRAQASVTAARAGQFTGALLIVGGGVWLGLGNLAGIWVALIGLAMVRVSRAQAREVLVITALADLRVADVIPPPGRAAVPGWQTVQSFLDRQPDGGQQAGAGAFALRDLDGNAAGILTLSQLVLVPPGHRDSMRLADIATPAAGVVTTTMEEPLGHLLSRLAIRPANPAALHTAGYALVVSGDGGPAGVLTPADFSRAGQLGLLMRGGRAP
ncbi:MAG TPA: site-2 protease family protein [Streptosporangiaceae bacterium]|nr:site-2 protease family protein [Streptosporangiaceae bacterium]